jgi:hypothetical protein
MGLALGLALLAGLISAVLAHWVETILATQADAQQAVLRSWVVA